MLTAWRLVHKRKVDEAFTGTGSRRYGGRWNYKGIGVVYVSDSLALAVLEIIVHAASYQALRDYVSIKVIFPKALGCLCKRYRQAAERLAGRFPANKAKRNR